MKADRGPTKTKDSRMQRQMTRIGPDQRSSLLIRRPPGSRDRVGTTIARVSAVVRSRDRGRTHLSISRCSLDTVVATLVGPAAATIEAAMTGLGLTIVIIAAAPAAVAIIEITGTAAVVTTIAAEAMTEGTIGTTGLAAIETIVITGIAAVSMRRRVEHLAVPVAAAIGTSVRAAGSTASLQTLVEEAPEQATLANRTAVNPRKEKTESSDAQPQQRRSLNSRTEAEADKNKSAIFDNVTISSILLLSPNQSDVGFSL